MFRIPAAYIAAIAVSSLYFFVVFPLKGDSFVTDYFMAMAGELVWSFLPWLICVIIGFVFSIRNPLYYVAWACVPLILPLTGLLFADQQRMAAYIAPSGVIGGLIYWALAGRVSGKCWNAEDQSSKSE